MNNQSPPKRVTRARAAAKTDPTDVKVKVATAASKAKAVTTRSVPVTKRKTRADDAAQEDVEEPSQPIIEVELPKTTRGRRAKQTTVEPEVEPQMDEAPVRRTRRAAVAHTEPEMDLEELPAKPARGRQKKAIVQAPAPPAPAPTRSLRGRQVLVASETEGIAIAQEPIKKTTRGRAATLTKAAPPKKSVKFQEPDKENFVPLLAMTKGKAKAADVETGLKAKPVRKPAAARATRGRPKVEEPKSSPLSPKKATQMSAAPKDQSDDELAIAEKTPMKPLMKSPIKAPGSIFGTGKKLNFSTSITVNRVTTQDLGASMMGSPARRPPQSPFKDALKTSPQRVGLGDTMLKSPFKLSMPGRLVNKPADASSPFKASLLQSPARRPQSPMKVTEAGSPSKSMSTFAVTPKVSKFKISQFTTPRTLTKSAVRPGQMLPPHPTEKLSGPSEEVPEAEVLEQEAPKLSFTGRLSSIVPRDVDPAAASPEPIIEAIEVEAEVEPIVEEQSTTDPAVMNDTVMDDTMTQDAVMDTNTPPCSPPANNVDAFSLREMDEHPFSDSDSEDELASSSPQYSPIPLGAFKISSHDFAAMPATPTPFGVKTPRTNATIKASGKNRTEKIGFTPLARQLTDWMAASPEKSEHDASESDESSSPEQTHGAISPDIQPSPTKSTYFDDEMTIREEMTDCNEEEEEVAEPVFEAINFAPVAVDEEDVALAHEAEEMSFLDSDELAELEDEDEDVLLVDEQDTILPIEQVEECENLPEQEEVLEAAAEVEMETGVTDKFNFENHFQSVEEEFGLARREPSPAPSEASQEYGDENAMPIDPQLLALTMPSTPKFVTPKRVLSDRVFHTVSKVPLKPAADDTPMRPSPVKRSASSSKLPVQRPSGLGRSNTVISYSPTKRTSGWRAAEEESEDVVMQDLLATPSKPDTDPWSVAATPARTPRRDLNNGLLKGAIVFVDVHTTEGADASTLFTELLTQMGAKCVKRWDWNPASEEGGKIGVTHIVFKDGGKRTLEKARETGGVVTCVGVGWVLDCERENKWLAEGPYSIDTSMVPRGGHRRRKSMEPRALAKLNGLTPSTPGPTRPARKTMSPSKAAYVMQETPFTSKSRRRDSVQWVRSPASSTDDKSEEVILSPVPAPATPAQEASSYAEEGLYGEETPVAQTPYFLHKELLVQKTAPPGKRYFDGAEGGNGGFLNEKKDETVMLRLMAARRKSLQWAPKVGSPLSKCGEW